MSPELPELQIEEFRYDDGTIWTYSHVRTMLLQGTPGVDLLIGFDDDDLLTAARAMTAWKAAGATILTCSTGIMTRM